MQPTGNGNNPSFNRSPSRPSGSVHSHSSENVNAENLVENVQSDHRSINEAIMLGRKRKADNVSHIVPRKRISRDLEEPPQQDQISENSCMPDPNSPSDSMFTRRAEKPGCERNPTRPVPRAPGKPPFTRRKKSHKNKTDLIVEEPPVNLVEICEEITENIGKSDLIDDAWHIVDKLKHLAIAIENEQRYPPERFLQREKYLIALNIVRDYCIDFTLSHCDLSRVEYCNYCQLLDAIEEKVTLLLRKSRWPLLED